MKSDYQIANEIPESAENYGHPLLIGLRGAKANFIPGLIVQTIMVVLLLSYYFFEPARYWLACLAEVKRQSGYWYSWFSGAIAGGILPELLVVAVFQKWRVRRENLSDLVFGILLWGISSVIVDLFYHLQVAMFGSQANISTVIKKVLVDQFVYNPVWAAPFGLACYEWKNQNFRIAGLSRVLTGRFYKQKTLPALIATWGVWIPVVTVVYSLPSLLQLPLCSLALTFWVMLFAWINREHQQNAGNMDSKLSSI